MAAKKEGTDREPIDIANLNVKNKARSTQVHDAAADDSAPAAVKVQPMFEPEAELVAMPSHGYLYQNNTEDENVLGGEILVRPMTLTEEKILSTNRLIKTGQALDMVFRNCVKSDINPSDLLSSDRLFLMFWLRAISYGNEYTFSLRCPNNTCNRKFKYTVDLGNQPVKEIEPDTVEPIEVKLPKSGATLFYNLPRGRTEAAIRRQQRDVQVNVDDVDNSMTDRLKIMTARIITPDGEELEKNKWQMFFNSLVGFDAAAIRESITETDAGVEPIKDISCPFCDEQFDEDIPVTADFFRL